MSTHAVARVGEIPDGARRVFDLGGLSVGVFHVGGRYYALLNRCPHQAGALCDGRLWSGLTTADRPGEYVNRADIPTISCIWHGWEFDLRTGHSVCDPQRLRVRAYDVRVEPGGGTGNVALQATTYRVEESEGWIVVDLERRPELAAAVSRDA